jgi:hypothetical protein
MVRVRFTPAGEEPTPPLRQTGPIMKRREPTTEPGGSALLPPVLPSGYSEAATLAKHYRRSFTRLSRSMQSYGPIPREIPSKHLHLLAPPRQQANTAPITEDLPKITDALPVTQERARHENNTTLLTAVCIFAAMVIVGSWAGSQFVSSPFPKPTASQKIARVNQLDPAQYRSSGEYNTWAYSTCSAAAMTEVINAYGHGYRLTDILKVENAKKQITPELGLLYGTSSIASTVSAFGFNAVALDHPSLEGILAAANAGTPVIVGFRDPRDFPTGHILVVRGGDAHHIDMVDSSKFNLQSLSRATFQYYYDGFAVLVTPNDAQVSSTPDLVPAATGYSVLGQPSIRAAFINQVLSSYHSPAAGKGQALYDDGVHYGVDPVFALAFFQHESLFGTQGMATITLGLGNERCLSDRPCVNTQGLPCQAGQSCYAQFSSWEDGFTHWYQLITGSLYQGAGLTTIATIIPRYAPSADNNNESAYIWSVEHAVDTWRAGKVVA